MMDFITAPLVVGFICLGIYALFELFVRRKERLLIIEKISERMDIADLGKRLSLPSYSLPRFSFSSLKTGCLLMGIGLGILVGFFCNLIGAANCVMSHSDTVINSNRIKFRSEASQLLNFRLHQLPDFMQVHVSRNKLCKRIDDSDNGFTHLILLHAVGCP